jgi:hypothetical protein
MDVDPFVRFDEAVEERLATIRGRERAEDPEVEP